MDIYKNKQVNRCSIMQNNQNIENFVEARWRIFSKNLKYSVNKKYRQLNISVKWS